ncbi:MAG: hypothetical protein J6I72_05495 [Muribaculaceae bacterium]|nr:hypothetical protein [Muribaculaceae bacterium]
MPKGNPGLEKNFPLQIKKGALSRSHLGFFVILQKTALFFRNETEEKKNQVFGNILSMLVCPLGISG